MFLTNKKLDVKFFLWGLFLLQIFLISVFLAFGSLLVSNIQQGELTGSDYRQPDGSGSHQARPTSWFNVKFISNQSSPLALTNDDLVADQQTSNRRMRHPRFHLVQPKTVPKPDNYTKYYRLIYYHDGYREQQRLCFIEGTRFPEAKPIVQKLLTSAGPHTKKTNETELDTGGLDVGTLEESERTIEEEGDGTEDNDVLADGRCRCLPEWHGPDCGLPEVLWRAFIASRIPPRNQTAAPRKVPKRIFYIIDTNFISVEVLEIQIMELIDVVNMFVLCDRSIPVVGATKSEAYSLAEHMNSVDFLKQNQKKILLLEDATCSGKNIFRKMKKFIVTSDMQAEDILLYSRTDEILNRRAVNYFRWYDNWPQPVRFRLKYNVFGFFWQHPDSTRIGSAACQLSTVDEVYRSDPEALLRIDKPVMLIGDLNHYGGWFCRHCYQPIDIVKYLEFIALVGASSSTSNSGTNQSSYLPDPKQSSVMNGEYVQNLIASGKYFDGQTNLNKLQRHVDKYYAPDYVRENSWRFDNIVINLFARWEDSVIDDEYFS
ncbi:beta-1,4-mannosyl-glycoprotein 4-beta-N-acetylglucosaminyltransferase [Malaya genurostris]|uniref:beta-1,4-mannosyl-glycoprotein 4-beta-N-acetylglucosaminyltransferase n=1 Tax=Malaya genurostris TaxID=325434 RepID=UPI0026F3D8EC|nr:beta-1,4-mannosyl-glycoprotein 4-beta-N-acetylglucosaminyltransferase [Malaya genurostris]